MSDSKNNPAAKALQAAEAKAALEAKKAQDAAKAEATKQPTAEEIAAAEAKANEEAEAAEAKAKALAAAKPKFKKGEFVNPFTDGVTYAMFDDALGKESVETYCKGKLNSDQIAWISIEINHYRNNKKNN